MTDEDRDDSGETGDGLPPDDLGLPPPLNADKPAAPPAISSSYGEEVPRDA
ncbi:hypothetical protein [Leifsonia sp. NPDC077715]|uniref:hypothetical protein n=1 Tax=Leifsonia sp. NPDC077715 TaxID=3155539 RepID=UPI0034243A77